MHALKGEGKCDGLTYKERLVIFYAAKNKSKLDTVDDLLAK